MVHCVYRYTRISIYVNDVLVTVVLYITVLLKRNTCGVAQRESSQQQYTSLVMHGRLNTAYLLFLAARLINVLNRCALCESVCHHACLACIFNYTLIRHLHGRAAAQNHNYAYYSLTSLSFLCLLSICKCLFSFKIKVSTKIAMPQNHVCMCVLFDVHCYSTAQAH